MNNREEIKSIQPKFPLLGTLITAALVILKVCKVIDISWWWAFSPVWIWWGTWLFLVGLLLILKAIIK